MTLRYFMTNLPPGIFEYGESSMAKIKLSLCLNKHHAMKTLGNGRIVPRMLNFDARWRWVVSFTFRPLYVRGRTSRLPLDSGLGGPQCRCGRCGEESNSQPLPGIETRSSSRNSSVTIPTELSRLPKVGRTKANFGHQKQLYRRY
jgi:hypothetical protein